MNKPDQMINPSRDDNHRAQLYLDFAGVFFVVIDKNQQVIQINRKGCEILGYPETEIVGKNWFEHFLPDRIRAEARRAFEALMAGNIEPVENFENPVLTKTRQERVIGWHNTVIKDEQGQPVATLSSGIDITEQRQAQEALKNYKDQLQELVEQRTNQLQATNKKLEAEIKQHKQTEAALIESQIRFAGILDIANEAIISINQEQKIVLFNKGAEKIFGYLASEIIDQPIDLLIPTDFVGMHSEYIKDFAADSEKARLMGNRGEIFGRRRNGQVFPASASISKLEIDERKIFTVVLRDITERKQIEHERERRILELRALNDSVRAISAELSLEQVLKKITQAAKDLVQAEYAALGLHDGHGRLYRFITVGIDPADQAKIGPLPAGKGLLGYLLYRGESMIVENIASHPSSAGFPEYHPKMNGLLGVPIFSKGDLIGAIYLTNKKENLKFTEADQQLVEMLAVHAAIAIENAQLYEQTQRLAILEERERFARDLHDGIIQSIYAVGLALDQAKLDIRPTNYAAQKQIELSLNSLASVIKDIRNYIFDLRPQALKYKGLNARLDGLIKELRVNTLLPIQVQLEPDIDAYLTDTQARHVFHIAHEALANAARHAKPTRISLNVTRINEQITVTVEDDGIGFKPRLQMSPGHHGLDNMLARAAQLNAKLDIDSAPGYGTRLTLKFRCGRQKTEA